MPLTLIVQYGLCNNERGEYSAHTSKLWPITAQEKECLVIAAIHTNTNTDTGGKWRFIVLPEDTLTVQSGSTGDQTINLSVIG